MACGHTLRCPCVKPVFKWMGLVDKIIVVLYLKSFWDSYASYLKLTQLCQSKEKREMLLNADRIALLSERCQTNNRFQGKRFNWRAGSQRVRAIQSRSKLQILHSSAKLLIKHDKNPIANYCISISHTSTKNRRRKNT